MATYAFSDIHGMYKIWEQIRDYCKEDDKIYFLGDAIDRGKDGIKIMKELLADPRVTYLMGNHEQMMLNEVKDIWRMAHDDNYTTDDIIMTFYYTSNWLQNGGGQTLKHILKLSWKELNELLDKIKAMPTLDIYTNANGQDIFLCHAGFSIHATEVTAFDMLWDRNHFNEKWENMDEEEESIIIVHGHTPVISMREYFYHNIPDPRLVYKYCDGHKIDIDMGTYHTKITALLNLDTLETVYFF